METLLFECAEGGREALLRSAAACFAKYGYEAASIRLVASMAGRSSSLISYHFGGKEGLYRHVIRDLLFRDGILEFKIDTGNQAHVSPRVALYKVILKLLKAVDATANKPDLDNEVLKKILISELYSPKPEVRDLLMDFFIIPAKELYRTLKRIRPDLSHECLVFWTITVHECCLLQIYMPEIYQIEWPECSKTRDSKMIAMSLCDFIYNGIIGLP